MLAFSSDLTLCRRANAFGSWLFPSAASIPPVVHSMAMERYCPNRALCEKFLGFIQSDEAQKELNRLGYASPPSQLMKKKE